MSATGTGLSYQWYKGSTALAGQTGSSLALANVSAADAGAYTVVVSWDLRERNFEFGGADRQCHHGGDAAGERHE